jgi:hypothetical protein
MGRPFKTPRSASFAQFAIFLGAPAVTFLVYPESALGGTLNSRDILLAKHNSIIRVDPITGAQSVLAYSPAL